jgi:predicted MPP superfamily phosphohydrolase
VYFYIKYYSVVAFIVLVSCGSRTWGPPIRIGSKCEVVDIMIKFK